MMSKTYFIIGALLSLSVGAVAMLYEGPVGACNADGSPFRVCSNGIYCVSCSAGAGAVAIFFSQCAASGGSVIPGQPDCSY